MAGENSIRPKGFREWWENYWYHYKWHTIVAFVLILAVAISTVQCSSRPKYDYQLVLAVGTVEMAPAQVEALEEQIAAVGTDQNGDGLVKVNLIDCTYSSTKSSYAIVTAKRQKLQSIFMNQSDTLLFICDKACYDWLDSIREGGFMEDLGLSKEDGRYFSLTDTKLYKEAKSKNHKELTWPADLRISRRKVSGMLIEKEKNIEKYMEKADTLLSAIIQKNS